MHAQSLYMFRDKDDKKIVDVNSISSGVNIGSIQFDDIKKIQNSLKKNNDDEWSKTAVIKRSTILNKVADLIEKDPYELIFILLTRQEKQYKMQLMKLEKVLIFCVITQSRLKK